MASLYTTVLCSKHCDYGEECPETGCALVVTHAPSDVTDSRLCRTVCITNSQRLRKQEKIGVTIFCFEL